MEKTPLPLDSDVEIYWSSEHINEHKMFVSCTWHSFHGYVGL